MLPNYRTVSKKTKHLDLVMIDNINTFCITFSSLSVYNLCIYLFKSTVCNYTIKSFLNDRSKTNSF